MDFDEKRKKLDEIISGYPSVIVSFSGGVDSSVLAAVASAIHGGKAIAVTLDSCTLLPSELENARRVAEEVGIKHVIIAHDEIANKDVASNPINRCYYCKKENALRLIKLARELGFEKIIEGTNASEIKGHRPGFKAVRETGLESPLVGAGFTKDEVRRLAKELRLSCADKPSTACLSSRIPTGEEITREKLAQVRDSEEYLRSLGLSQVRVRHHGDLARIEVLAKDFDIIVREREDILQFLVGAGFRRVCLDLAGYESMSS